ncbi:hypothetical protein X739_11840 [Mesorhizobium sp. LNHC220B00]|nr:hypothetical protein [Mesorhizobium sp. LNHC220B00]ESY86398.1 hypothetical protein X739_11840 [Mesorhizobium sp. LNHC220B00]
MEADPSSRKRSVFLPLRRIAVDQATKILEGKPMNLIEDHRLVLMLGKIELRLFPSIDGNFERNRSLADLAGPNHRHRWDGVYQFGKLRLEGGLIILAITECNS